MNIEVLLTEAEIAQEFAESMEARDLPEKFFYWFPLSVRAWLDLARDKTHQRPRFSWGEFGDKVQALIEHLDAAVSVVSFGAGDGANDRILLAALQAAGRTIKYFPVDASQSLLELACSGAEDDDLETMGIKADISSPVHLVLASDVAESPKLFLMTGNTLGGFDPLDQIRHVGECLRGEDRLIIDGDIYSDDALEVGNNPAVRKFAFAPLASVGLAEEDGELHFEHKRDDRHEGLHLITKHFRAERDLRFSLAGEEITIPRGERVFMNFRYLYSPAAFRWLIEDHAGLKILDEIRSPDGRLITVVCSR